MASTSVLLRGISSSCLAISSGLIFPRLSMMRIISARLALILRWSRKASRMPRSPTSRVWSLNPRAFIASALTWTISASAAGLSVPKSSTSHCIRDR
jgi:hypothetical protein